MEEDRDEDDAPLIDGMPELPGGSFRLPRAPAGLRETVLERTTRAVRARRGRRRLAVAVALAVAWAAGAGTTRLLDVIDGRRARDLAEAPRAPAPSRAIEAAADAVLDPQAILRQVSRAPMEDRIRLLKQAGDAYLLARGDLEKALDCYRQLLELAPEARTRPDDGDTWLLAALKQGQTNEIRR